MGYNIKKVLTETFTAGADLSAAQYHFVKLNADRQVILTAADTDKPQGILQNKPTSGQAAEVMVIGRTPLVSAEALAAGSSVNPDASGHAEVCTIGTDTTKYNYGTVVEHSSAAGEYANADINCANPSRGA